MIILVLRLQDLKSYDGQMGRNFTWPSVSRIILKLPEFGTCTGVGEKLIFYQFLNLFEASSPFFVLHPSYFCCFGRFTPWTVYKGNVCWPFFVLGDEFLLPSSTTNFLCIVENHHFLCVIITWLNMNQRVICFPNDKATCFFVTIPTWVSSTKGESVNAPQVTWGRSSGIARSPSVLEGWGTCTEDLSRGHSSWFVSFRWLWTESFRISNDYAG